MYIYTYMQANKWLATIYEKFYSQNIALESNAPLVTNKLYFSNYITIADSQEPSVA